MRLLSFLNNGRETWGAIVGDGVVDLGSKLSHATLQDFIAKLRFRQARSASWPASSRT